MEDFKMSDDEKMTEKEYQEFLEFRKSLDDTKEKNNQSQDKMVIAISSALFGLLLALVNNGLLTKMPHTLFIALIASNALALICALVSYSTANKSIDKKMQIALYRSNEKNHWEFATKCLNISYIIATCATIIFLSIIMWANIFKRRKL